MATDVIYCIWALIVVLYRAWAPNRNLPSSRTSMIATVGFSEELSDSMRLESVEEERRGSVATVVVLILIVVG
jgi:hypothetical protein